MAPAGRSRPTVKEEIDEEHPKQQTTKRTTVDGKQTSDSHTDMPKPLDEAFIEVVAPVTKGRHVTSSRKGGQASVGTQHRSLRFLCVVPARVRHVSLRFWGAGCRV